MNSGQLHFASVSVQKKANQLPLVGNTNEPKKNLAPSKQATIWPTGSYQVHRRNEFCTWVLPPKGLFLMDQIGDKYSLVALQLTILVR
jgi:hypothetical protein